jgi:inhibitor of KinA sporulation pathway (predicted exonuclease)
MIDWYIDITKDSFKNDKYINKVVDTVSPYMDYFCKRLTEIDNCTLEQMNAIFSDIIKEMPIMTPKIHNDEFFIEYNGGTYIHLTDSTKQIYREIKLHKLLSHE